MVTDELARIPAARRLVRQEPAVTPWQQCPYGHLPAQDMAPRAAEQSTAAEDAERLAAEYERRAAEQQSRLDAPATEAGRGENGMSVPGLARLKPSTAEAEPDAIDGQLLSKHAARSRAEGRR